ncbi:RNA-processing protein [Candidatus Bathyarchaeota archaeon]|nr:MAG: RNA-processing protein [Candidatus Bathyarchaeota archaeon]
METKVYVKIPMERVGVLIGPGGKVKRRIEEASGVELSIDSETGNVEIGLRPETKDPSVILQVQNLVKAIGRGFSPQRAFKLLDEDVYLDIIDLRDYVGRSKNALARVRGRIIGRNGRSRELIEELTDTYISVYGHTVSIIGRVEDIEVAKEAILMLVKGRFHKSVFSYLYRERGRRKRRLELWEGPSERTREMMRGPQLKAVRREVDGG